MNRGYEPSRVVHLRNLPEDIDMDDVMELGRPFGPVISALRIKETQVSQLFVSSWVISLHIRVTIHATCSDMVLYFTVFNLHSSIFTHGTHSIARYMLQQRGWLAGCLSVTHRYYTKTAKPILKLFLTI